MRLYIAEKKEVAKAISMALGGPEKPAGAAFELEGGDAITWASGHLLRLSDPEEHDATLKRWSLEQLPMAWPISHTPVATEYRARQLEAVIRLARRADEIVNAGDPDPEGQRLIDEIIEYAGLTDKPVKRVLINDNTPDMVRKVIDALEDNERYRGLSLSALARAVCDQRYGYNLTRAYTLQWRRQGGDEMLSVGRVQTPILGLVVSRDRQHEQHKKQAFYTVAAVIDLIDLEQGMSVTAKYVPADQDPTDAEGRLRDKEFAAKLAASLPGMTARVASVITREHEKAPPLPYNLLALQADASGRFHYGPEQVLEITQKLRDEHRAITYNRSDCRYLNDERHADAPALLTRLIRKLPELNVGNADPARKSKAFNSKKVGAHHGIIPTREVPELTSLPEAEQRIYTLIARAYVAQFHPPEKFRSTAVTFQAGEHKLTVTGRVDVDPGWRVLYRGDEQADTEDKRVNLESISVDDQGLIKTADSAKAFTKPQPRYTMQTLLRDLARVAKYVSDEKIRKLLLEKDADKPDEMGGIGTPATRASHIETLFMRRYVVEHAKHIISTELGRAFYDTLPPLAKTPDRTALWHEQQSRIENGTLEYEALIHDVDAVIAEEIARLQSEGMKMDVKKAGKECPACKHGVLKKRKGKNGAFWGCSRYPDCKKTYPDKQGKPDLNGQPKVQASDQYHCPQCAQDLIRRPARKKGVFWWGCRGYPKCEFRTFDKDGIPKEAASPPRS